jgi:hypothetical protein
MRPLFLTLLILLYASNALGQTPSPQTSPTPETALRRCEAILDSFLERGRVEYLMEPSHFGRTNKESGRTLYETQLGWAVLGFGLFAIALEIALMLRLKKGWGVQAIRIVGITLVLTSGLFLIVTGYSQEQIAPMIGLLGTIIGFLLGKTSDGTKEKDST